jgi:hypothetical protein
LKSAAAISADYVRQMKKAANRGDHLLIMGSLGGNSLFTDLTDFLYQRG